MFLFCYYDKLIKQTLEILYYYIKSVAAAEAIVGFSKHLYLKVHTLAATQADIDFEKDLFETANVWGLENSHICKGTGGSNPTISAKMLMNRGSSVARGSAIFSC